VALRWSDIDLDTGRLSISRAIVAGPDGLVAKDTNTHAARRVSLDDTCVAALEAHRQRAGERAALCGIDGRSSVLTSARRSWPTTRCSWCGAGPTVPRSSPPHALRTHRAYMLDGEPLFGVSVFAALDDIGPASLDGLLTGRMATYRQAHLPAAGGLVAAGFTLLSTFGRPHVTVVLESVSDTAVHRLLEALGPPEANPYRRCETKREVSAWSTSTSTRT
ncbi:MAG: hypothetical protein ACRDV9_10675, partial [Acidimicrobiia bacterium]